MWQLFRRDDGATLENRWGVRDPPPRQPAPCPCVVIAHNAHTPIRRHADTPLPPLTAFLPGCYLLRVSSSPHETCCSIVGFWCWSRYLDLCRFGGRSTLVQPCHRDCHW